ncbi:hypothetical protein [Portibacter marinus]|uniref:hypothetical protein n=1 Tax=Portibacter marinus TaxID=2898660 RepID=UPI001F434545|nr:hypothetical protein [Portibacter marinus]
MQNLCFILLMTLSSFCLHAQTKTDVIISEEVILVNYHSEMSIYEALAISTLLKKRGIELTYNEYKLDEKGKLIAVDFDIDFNNGNSGSASCSQMQFLGTSCGFFIDNRPDARNYWDRFSEYQTGGVKAC